MADITVVIATYNRKALLEETLESVLNLVYEDYKVIIVDDGSEESVLQYLRNFVSKHKDRFALVEQEHKGCAVTQAIAAREASTEYIYVLGSDDIIHPYALKKVMDIFKQDKSVDLIYGDVIEFYKDSFKKVKSYKGYSSNRAMRLAMFLSPRVPFKHSGIALRRKCILDVGNYDPKIKIKIDIDLLLSFLEGDKIIKHIPAVLVDFRMNPYNVSFDRLTGLRYWFKIIDKHERRVFLNIFFKIHRVFIELGKYIIEYIRYVIL